MEKSADTEEFAKYAGTISDISVPEQARFIGLGEATHGNIEFQQLKLEVFKPCILPTSCSKTMRSAR